MKINTNCISISVVDGNTSKVDYKQATGLVEKLLVIIQKFFGMARTVNSLPRSLAGRSQIHFTASFNKEHGSALVKLFYQIIMGSTPSDTLNNNQMIQKVEKHLTDECNGNSQRQHFYDSYKNIPSALRSMLEKKEHF
ncbi:MAG: hypothetical protein K9M07_04085 [Simkaniaceae bacterium]|nr:hypothetical protein [Simkaniaceae bacterium]MCF7852407.1 hypothetical protein [Simkaniaceae bacterium]